MKNEYTPSSYETMLIDSIFSEIIEELKPFKLGDEVEVLLEQFLRPFLLQIYLQGKVDGTDKKKINIYN